MSYGSRKAITSVFSFLLKTISPDSSLSRVIDMDYAISLGQEAPLPVCE